MFELITQILLLVGLYYLLKAVWPSIYNTKYFAWFGVAVFITLIAMAFIYPSNRTVGILWAIVSFPLRPLGLTLTLLAIALANGVEKVKGPQVMSAFLVLLICSLPITAYLLTAQTEQRTVMEAVSRQEASNPRQVRAIVVLDDSTFSRDPTARVRAQITQPDGGISVALQSRLIYAAELYLNRTQRGGTPIVVVSIGPQPVDEFGRPTGGGEAQGVIDVLTRNGVPQSQITLDVIGVDPRSSAISVRQIFLDAAGGANCPPNLNPCKKPTGPPPLVNGPRIPIVLVTPAIMIRRAASTFSRLNFEVTPRPTDFYIFQLQRGWELAALTDILPSAEALVITSRVVNEYLTTVYYFLRGWLADPLAV